MSGRSKPSKSAMRGGKRKLVLIVLAMVMLLSASLALMACEPKEEETKTPKTKAETASEIFEMIRQGGANLDPGVYNFGVDAAGSVTFQETSGAWSAVNGKKYNVTAKINLNTDPNAEPKSKDNEVFFELREDGAENPLIGIYYSDDVAAERNYIYIQSGTTKKAVEIYSLQRLITGKYLESTENVADIDIGAIVMSALAGFFSDASINESRTEAFLELNLEELFFADGKNDKIGIDAGLWGMVGGLIDFEAMGLNLTVDQLSQLKPQIKIGITFKFDKDPANGGKLSGANVNFESARDEQIKIETTDGKTLIDYTIPKAKIAIAVDTLAIQAGEKAAITMPTFDESWEIIELVNAKVTGKFSIVYANQSVVDLEYELVANVDLFDVITNYGQVSKLDANSYFYLQLRHVNCDGSCEFCRNRVSRLNKADRTDVALLDVAFSPADFGNTNVYISVAPTAILTPDTLAKLAQMDPATAGAAGVMLGAWQHNLISIDLEALFYALNPAGYQTTVKESAQNAAFDLGQLPSIVKTIIGALDGISFNNQTLEIKMDTIKSLAGQVNIEGMGNLGDLIAGLLDGKVYVDGQSEPMAATAVRANANLTFGTTAEDRANAKEKITTKLVGGNRVFDFKKDISLANVSFDIDHAITSEGVYSGNYITIVDSQDEILLGEGVEKISLDLLENILRNGYVKYNYTDINGTQKSGKTKVLGIYGFDKASKLEQDVIFVTELAGGNSLIENLSSFGLSLSIPGAIYQSKLTIVDSLSMAPSAEGNNPIMADGYKTKINDTFDLKAKFDVTIEGQTSVMELTGKIVAGSDSASVTDTLVTRTNDDPIVVEWSYAGMKFTKTVEMFAIETLTSEIQDYTVKMGDKLRDWLTANFNDNSKSISVKYEGIETPASYTITSQMVVDAMVKANSLYMANASLTNSNNTFIKEGVYDVMFTLAGKEVKLFTLTIEAPHALGALMNADNTLLNVAVTSKGNTAFDKTYNYRLDVTVKKDGEIVPANSYEILVKGLDENDHLISYILNGYRKYSVLALTQDAVKNFDLEFYGLEGSYDITVTLVYGSSASNFFSAAYESEVKGVTLAKKDWNYVESAVEQVWQNEIKANAFISSLLKINYTNKYGEVVNMSFGYNNSSGKYRVYKSSAYEWDDLVISCVDADGKAVEFFSKNKTSADLEVGKVYTLSITFTDDDGKTFTATNDITIIAS